MTWRCLILKYHDLKEFIIFTKTIAIISIYSYNQDHKAIWDQFIDEISCGLFLFKRDFMSYHSDRFVDRSLVIFRNDQLCAVFPANQTDGTIYSHQGLTFGGLLCRANESYDNLTDIVSKVFDFYRKIGFKALYVKLMPSFFDSHLIKLQHLIWSELGGINVYKERTMSIDFDNYRIHKSKLKRFRKYQNFGFQIVKTTDFHIFWNSVLIPRLHSKHSVAPVHSLDEIQRLANLFPENILQYCIFKDGEILAGITLFVNDGIVKSQYGATTDSGEDFYALDFLFISLIQQYDSLGFRYFDMGSVRSDHPSGINEGLWKQKQELGCSDYFLPHFEFQL